MYYERDKNNWQPQIDRKGFVQKCTQPAGLDTLMFRARTSMNAKLSEIQAVLVDIDVRKRWETILFDFT